MGKAVAYELRCKIVKRKQSGDNTPFIAMELSISESVVKKIWKQYREEGERCLHTKYSNCGGVSRYDENFRSEVSRIRDNG